MASSSPPSREAREQSPEWPPLSEEPIGSEMFNPAEIEPRARWLKISSGGYANVYGTTMIGMPVAIKETSTKKRTSTPSLLREIRYLRQCGPHPNVIQLYGSFRESGRVCLVMEHAKYVLRLTKVVQNVNLVKVLAGVVRALVRLHTCGIVHRDVKSRNVLVTSKGSSSRSLLIDFGLACNLNDDPPEWLSRVVGTRRYRPPEMGAAGYTAHPSVDIYSFGVMVRLILTQVNGAISGADRTVLEQLQQRCTALNPTERPTAWEALCLLQEHARHSVTLAETPRERLVIYSANPGSSTSTSTSSSYTSSSNSKCERPGERFSHESRRSSDSGSSNGQQTRAENGSGAATSQAAVSGGRDPAQNGAGAAVSSYEMSQDDASHKRKRSKKSKHKKKKKRRRS